MADNDFKQENDSEKVATVNEVKEERTVNEVQNVTTVHEKKPQTDTKVSESTKDKTDSQLTDSPQKGDEDKKEASLDRELDAPASVDPEKEKKGPFQTGDIIEYMFKEWLIAGMNWLWVEIVYHHDKGYYKRKYAKEYAAAARKKELKELSTINSTLIFYEAPQRIEETLTDMLEVLGDRKIAVARELTKKFEEKYLIRYL